MQSLLALRSDSGEDDASLLAGRRFTVTSLDGREVELKRNGAALLVTSATKKEYCMLLEKYKLAEFDVQVCCDGFVSEVRRAAKRSRS